MQDEFGDDFTIISVTAVYARLGFLPCGMDVTLEEGVDKVAIYAIGDEATHAARQLPNGLWTSKLGPYEDITHTLKGLEGGEYGYVVGILRRDTMSPTDAKASNLQ